MTLIKIAESRKPLQIKAKTETVAELTIYDDIGQDGWFSAFGAKELDKALKELDTDNPNIKDLHVRINSPGGSVFEGYVIYNRLKQYKATITVFIDGIAASIASVIAMAGDEVVMGEASQLMIHKPWSYTVGNAGEHEDTIELLDRLEEQLIQVYRKKTGKDSTELRQMLKNETWINQDEAVEMGFADRVASDDETIRVAASFNRDWITKQPKNMNSTYVKNKISSFKDEVEGYLARNK